MPMSYLYAARPSPPSLSPNRLMKQESRMIAKTLQALEPVLAQELEALGATDIEQGRRMVSFTGDKKVLYRANYRLRTALRILLPIASFRANDPDELYRQLKRLDWSEWMQAGDTFAFDTVVYSETFTHSKYVGYRAKDALVDFFTERGEKRPMVRLDNPDRLFHIHISHDEVTLALDSSGESLHKRGWRAAQTEAPLSEVLAAGILLLAGWQGETDFIDPMCGSGTLLIEAALIACGIAPGSFRKSFAFQRWADYDPALFADVEAECRELKPFEHHIYGSDSSIEAVKVARHNVRTAGLADLITVSHRAMQDCPAPEAPALIVTNPPYGERLRLRDGEELYRMIGERLKHNYAGSTAWILAYKLEHFDKIGLRHSDRIKMLNGSLECELRAYTLFAGKREDFKRAGGEGEEERAPRAPRPERERGPRSEKPRRFDRPRREDRREGGRREGDRPSFSDRPRREDRREGGRREGDRPSFSDRPRREDRREGGRRDGDRPSFSDRPRREDRREGGRRDGDRPSFSDRPRREDRREGGRREGDRPSFSDRPRREDRREGGRPAKKNEGGLWPNDRFRYRDEEGCERIRNKRSKHIQTFSGGGDE